MKDIRVLYSFARSGGTLANQLLGIHPQCLILSEVNPAASYKAVVDQACEWLGLLDVAEKREFSQLPYHRQIGRLHELALAKQKHLIVRDWVAANFLPGCAGDRVASSFQLEQHLYLEHAGFTPVPLVVTRRGAEIYTSIRRSFPHLQQLDIETFASSYLKYARAVAAFPRVHLESLRSQPEQTLRRLLAHLDLRADHCALQLEKFHEFKQCTGNISLNIPGESSRATHILKGASLLSQASNIDTHPALLEADRLLGYEQSK